jgi:predicted RNA-binding Zn ribbon-like protein
MALRAVVELVNSATPPDTLESAAQLRRFVDTYRYTGSVAGDDAELATVRAARPALRRLLTAGRDEAARLVNEVLATHRAVPQLVRHDGFDYHLHAVARDAPLAERIAVESAMAVLDLVRADELSRLATCADPTCDGIVLDLSRNRSRRFCSTACGNRAAVAAYRARQR